MTRTLLPAALLAVLVACGADPVAPPAGPPAVGAADVAPPVAPVAAPVLDRLQGEWVSTEDAKSALRFAGDVQTDVYDGSVVSTGKVTVADKLPDDGGKADPNGAYLWVDSGEDRFLYQIDTLDAGQLNLMYWPRGNMLAYRRAK